MDKAVSPGQRSGCVRIPSSKSIVHRLLICAALGKEPVRISFNGLSKDILATVNCLRALGAEIAISDNQLSVQPARVYPENAVLPCGESGSTLRFLLPVVGALGMEGCFMMEGRLPDRPMKEYEALLSAHGMNIKHSGNSLFCKGKLTSGSYTLPGNISSQYFSGLLMALLLRKTHLLMPVSHFTGIRTDGSFPGTRFLFFRRRKQLRETGPMPHFSFVPELCRKRAFWLRA